MNSEREIVKRLFESKNCEELDEKTYTVGDTQYWKRGGKTYKWTSSGGRQECSEDEYYKALSGGTTGNDVVKNTEPKNDKAKSSDNTPDKVSQLNNILNKSRLSDKDKKIIYDMWKEYANSTGSVPPKYGAGGYTTDTIRTWGEVLLKTLNDESDTSSVNDKLNYSPEMKDFKKALSKVVLDNDEEYHELVDALLNGVKLNGSPEIRKLQKTLDNFVVDSDEEKRELAHRIVNDTLGATMEPKKSEPKKTSDKDYSNAKLGDEIKYNGKSYTIIDDSEKDGMLTLRPTDKVDDDAFDGYGDSFDDIHLDRSQLKPKSEPVVVQGHTITYNPETKYWDVKDVSGKVKMEAMSKEDAIGFAKREPNSSGKPSSDNTTKSSESPKDVIKNNLVKKYGSKVTLGSLEKMPNRNKPGHDAYFVKGYYKDNKGHVNHINDLMYVKSETNQDKPKSEPKKVERDDSESDYISYDGVKNFDHTSWSVGGMETQISRNKDSDGKPLPGYYLQNEDFDMEFATKGDLIKYLRDEDAYFYGYDSENDY